MSEKYSKKETVLLRELAKQTMEIAASEENKKKIQLWTDVNDLHPTRPVTLAYALPWHELNADGDLTLQCENTHLREIEQELRRQLYLHRHMPLDYVIEPCIRSKIMYKDTGYGIRVDEDTRSSDEDNAIVSRIFDVVGKLGLGINALTVALIIGAVIGLLGVIFQFANTARRRA